jgi:hypothetical protein
MKERYNSDANEDAKQFMYKWLLFTGLNLCIVSMVMITLHDLDVLSKW